MGGGVFERRQRRTEGKVTALQQSLEEQLGERTGHLIGEHTCVYATGSCGRGEMGKGSDLDAYIAQVDDERRELEPLVTAVRTANDAAGLPTLDGNGKYLQPVRATELLDLIGDPQDDGRGVLTKRMLLLLESRVLLGQPAHDTIVDKILDAYWLNEDLHSSDYLPFVLVNDIVRYWRIVLLNHESRLRDKRLELEQDASLSAEDLPAVLLAERRYKSYKMRLARCLTCFSALTYLLALTADDPVRVTRQDVRTMVGRTPLQRLRNLSDVAGRDVPFVDEMLDLYRIYLERTEEGKEAMVVRLREDQPFQRQVSRQGSRFTELMFNLVQELGQGRPLHRHMLV